MGMVDDAMGAVTSGSGDTIKMVILIVVIGGIALLLLVGGGFYWWFKKRWKFNVELKLVRSDGRIVMGEWAKGMYNAARGVFYLKRKGIMKPFAIKVFDIRKYLQGADLLTVIQVGPEDYRPVLNDSWESYVDEETGEKAAMINIKVDTGLNKAWKSAFDAAAKKAYSLQSFLSQFQTPIAVGIVIICCFVGFAILWTRVG
jgi:hypothetical protein